MVNKTIMSTLLVLLVGLVIISYAGEEKKMDALSSENIPETYMIDHLAKIYQPVTFSHGMHALVAEDCATCHHHSEAGQTPSCNECHGASSELKDVYHRLCIGCHKEMEMGPTGCIECHTKKLVQKTSIKLIKKKPKKGPEVLTLNILEKIYEPVTFSHGVHILITDDCAICHHHSEPGQTPACKECHGAPFDPKNLNMPGLKGAYHLQCMGCHQEMESGSTGCNECHTKKVTHKNTKVKQN